MDTAVRVKKWNQNLTSIPQDFDQLVTEMYLGNNEITRITNMSLHQYRLLRVLDIRFNGLIYIEDGSFDNNPYLEELNARKNLITYLPYSYGLAASSLRTIDLWDALNLQATREINFTHLTGLRWLNIGSANYRGSFDSAVLPESLEFISLNWARLERFPIFTHHTPNIDRITIKGNKITVIPNENLENLKLKSLRVTYNLLSTVPDLYRLPLENLELSNNPLVCNHSLCWVRMCPWMKPQLSIDDARCSSPQFPQGILLTSINPVILDCQHGEFYYKAYRHTYNKSAPQWAIYLLITQV